MCELIEMVAKVHEMSEQGDFRPISRLLVGFGLDVLLRRQWGYRDMVGHYLSQDELDHADFSSIYRFCTVFDQYLSLLHIGRGEFSFFSYSLTSCCSHSKVFPHITDGYSILPHESAKKVLKSTDIEETRFWHREFRSLVIKINHMKELLKLDRKLEVVLFRSGIGLIFNKNTNATFEFV